LIRVAVSARSSIVRAGLETIVRSSASLELAGVVDFTLVQAFDFEADVLLLDASDIGPDRLAALAEELSLPIVLLFDPSGAAFSNAPLRSGIRGFLPADSTPREIESAVQAVHAGLIVISPLVLPALMSEARAMVEAPAEPLTDRELEVLELIVEGLSNKLIAHRLGISEHTVKTHVASILSKLGATSRTEAVSQAIRRGLVML
jgi:DNA-binding NarL/FixJ family response regulator